MVKRRRLTVLLLGFRNALARIPIPIFLRSEFYQIFQCRFSNKFEMRAECSIRIPFSCSRFRLKSLHKKIYSMIKTPS